jgi:hypothetical protein
VRKKEISRRGAERGKNGKLQKLIYQTGFTGFTGCGSRISATQPQNPAFT